MTTSDMYNDLNHLGFVHNALHFIMYGVRYRLNELIRNFANHEYVTIHLNNHEFD